MTATLTVSIWHNVTRDPPAGTRASADSPTGDQMVKGSFPSATRGRGHPDLVDGDHGTGASVRHGESMAGRGYAVQRSAPNAE